MLHPLYVCNCRWFELTNQNIWQMSIPRTSSRKQTIFEGVMNFFQKDTKSPKKDSNSSIHSDTMDSQDTRGDLSFIIRKSVAYLETDMFQKSGKIFLGKVGKTVNDITYSLRLCQITGKEIIFTEIHGKEVVRYSLDNFVLQRLGHVPVSIDKREESAHVFGILFQEKEVLMCCLTLLEVGDWIEVLNLISMRNFANQQNTSQFRSKIELTYNNLKDEFKIFQETQQGDDLTNKSIFQGYKEKIEECMIFTEDDYEVKQNGLAYNIEKVSLYVEDEEIAETSPETVSLQIITSSSRQDGTPTSTPRYKTQIGVSDYELLKIFQILEQNFHQNYFGFEFAINVLDGKATKERATRILRALCDRKCMTRDMLNESEIYILKPNLVVFKVFGYKGESEEDGWKWLTEKLK
jgi:hypothetical protein